jgi:glycosyltransferase involved in cell wall biosynthesis
MIVVQINSECGRGSTGRIACAISDHLSNHGIENYILYSGNHKSDYSKGIQINSKLSIRIHQILSRVFGDQGFHSLYTTFRLVRTLRKLQPDVILLHNLHGYYLHLGVLFRYLQRYQKPVFWTLHDCWAFTGHCAHFLRVGCTKWEKQCFRCPARRNYPYSWFFDRSRSLYRRKKALFALPDQLHIITPSEWLASLVRRSFLGNRPITVIRNGIDLDVFHPVQSDFRERFEVGDRFMILGVASVWSDAKGLDLFLTLSKRCPAWQIVLVGVDEQLEKKLPSTVISIRRTSDRSELAKIYSAADVFLNPTREDTYPTVNMEAIACGTPVLTFNVGGCPEMLEPETGVVLQDMSIEAVMEALEQLRRERRDPERICSAAARFDRRCCLTGYLDLLGGVSAREKGHE